MVITSHGEGCFKLQSPGAVVVTQALKGGTTAKLKADIFIKTSDESSDIGAEHNISGPGEYEIKGVEVRGFPQYVYLIKMEDIKFGYFGGAAPIISEKMSGIDVLFIAAGKDAVKTIREVSPNFVFVIDGDVKAVEKELGVEAETLDKLAIKKKDMSDGKTRLIWLKN